MRFWGDAKTSVVRASVQHSRLPRNLSDQRARYVRTFIDLGSPSVCLRNLHVKC